MQSTISLGVNILSKLYTRSFARRVLQKTPENPGIRRQLEILEEKDESALDEIDLDELESDFMNVNQVYKQHKNELNFLHEKEKYHLVKNKYFKEEKINFLTWHDKEQIRYLNQTNPTEWSPEKLSTGFPALPETIKKIIKSNWTKDPTKIQNHDRAVEKNWSLLKQGKFKDILHPQLIEHLQKFSARKQTTYNKEQKHVTVIQQNKQINGEFSNIISSYEKLKNKTENKELVPEIEKDPTNYFFSSSTKINNKKMVTLSVLKEKQLIPEIQKEEIKTPENIENLKKLFKPNEDITSSDVDVSIPKKFVSKISNLDNSKLMPYPEKIMIPKGKYKKGSTYKLNDCYYDEFGYFLYRVPGMF